MKRCSKCRETKSLDEFYSDKTKIDGKECRCSACARAKSKKWRDTNPETWKAYNAEWYAANPERGRERAGNWYAENVERTRWRHILKKYKMTREQWFELLVMQEGMCAGPECGMVPTHVDHDHDCCPTYPTCGRCVRGLLCHGCNVRDVLNTNKEKQVA